MEHYSLCGFTSSNGHDCMKEVPKDFPVNLCVKHLVRAGQFYEEMKLFLHASTRRKAPAQEITELTKESGPSEAAEPHPGLVYYLRFADRIKIGYSADIYNRLNNVPWESVLALEPGTFQLEAKRHQKFQAFQVTNKREWFTDNPEMQEHIREVRARFPHLARLADSISAGGRGNRVVPMEDPPVRHHTRTRLRTGQVVRDVKTATRVRREPVGNEIAGSSFNY